MFGDDVARSGQRLFGGGDFFFRVDERGGDRQRIAFKTLLADQIGQRFESFFLGDGGAGAALRLVGQVKIFQFGFGNRPLDLLAQFVGQLALFVD